MLALCGIHNYVDNIVSISIKKETTKKKTTARHQNQSTARFALAADKTVKTPGSTRPRATRAQNCRQPRVCSGPSISYE